MANKWSIGYVMAALVGRWTSKDSGGRHGPEQNRIPGSQPAPVYCVCLSLVATDRTVFERQAALLFQRTASLALIYDLRPGIINYAVNGFSLVRSTLIMNY